MAQAYFLSNSTLVMLAVVSVAALYCTCSLMNYMKILFSCPQGSISVSINATDLFDVADEDEEFLGYEYVIFFYLSYMNISGPLIELIEHMKGLYVQKKIKCA